MLAAEQQLTQHDLNNKDFDQEKLTFNEIQNRLTNEVCEVKTGKSENAKVG